MDNFIQNYTNISNSIAKLFNKIYFVLLFGRDYSKKIEWLEAMKRVPLYVKYISIYPYNVEELENLTNPNLHITPINNLRISKWKSFKISSKAIENLKAIYPNSITLTANQRTKDESIKQALFRSFIKLLSKLDQTSLVMDIQEKNFNFKLEFINVIWKVVKSKEKCSYIRAKSVRICCVGDELCWIK